MKKIIPLIFILLTFAACKTDLVYISVMNPPPVVLPASIKKAGILNRSIPTDENSVLATAHKINSLESRNMIKEGSEAALTGLQNGLVEAKMFDELKPLDAVRLPNPGGGVFLPPLSWAEVEQICQSNQVDALFVLEVFDTDLKVIPAAPIPKDLSNPVNIINAVQTPMDMVTTVKTGWRIYDSKNKYILDELPFANSITYTGSAVTVTANAEAILGRKEAVKQLSNRMGYEYSDRVRPYWTKVTRDYYVKGTYNFKIAKRKARTGNWDDAAVLWEKETKNTKRKIAGRACYNMAIINEINGNLDTAIQWAQKAYEDYNNKLALRYVNQLKNRKRKDKILNGS
jgi:hypothetical protein